MLPLAISALPTSHDGLTESLEEGLRKYGITPKSVALKGGSYPEIKELKLDLTGATVTRETRLPVAKGKGGELVKIAHFSLRAAPLRLEKTPVRLTMEAHGTEFEFGLNKAKEAALILASAEKGDVEVQMQHGDLEELIRSMAAEAAAEHGVEVKGVRLVVTTAGPRSVSFKAEVKAKMFVMSATITVSGDACDR
jgi:hypothetical protein